MSLAARARQFAFIRSAPAVRAASAADADAAAPMIADARVDLDANSSEQVDARRGRV
jgi:hypothetical protein